MMGITMSCNWLLTNHDKWPSCGRALYLLASACGVFCGMSIMVGQQLFQHVPLQEPKKKGLQMKPPFASGHPVMQ